MTLFCRWLLLVAPLMVMPLTAFAQTGVLSGGTVMATGSTTSRSLADRFSQLINVKDFGAVGDGSTDDSAAVSAAVARSNTLFAASPRVHECIYFPQGVYRVVSALTQFSQSNPGCILGEASHKSYVKVDTAYSGDLFSWDEAWMATAYNFPTNTTLNVSNDWVGPRVSNITIFGDTTSSNTQTAFDFYDRADHALFQNVDVYFLHGPCFSVGATTKVTSQAYMRESEFYNVKCWYTGTSSLPAVELNTQGSGNGTDEVRFYFLDIEAPASKGLVIRNAGTGGAVQLLSFFGLRVEHTTAGDAVTIGDTTLTGSVNSIDFHGLTIQDVGTGTNGFTVVDPAVANAPFAINVYGGVIGSGAGNGLNFQGGRNINISLENIGVSGTGIVVAANTKVGGFLRVDGGGAEYGWTKSVDSTTVNSLVFPPPPTPQSNTPNFSNQTFIGGGQSNFTSGLQSSAFGFNNNATGAYSMVNGARSTDRGRLATNCHSGGEFAAQGDQQACSEQLFISGTGSSAMRLTANGLTAASTNCINIANGTAYGVSIHLHARDNTTPGKDYDWVLPNGFLSRDATVGTTALTSGTPLTSSRGSVTGAGVTAVADTTNGCLDLEFTPPSANTTDSWHAVAVVNTYPEVQ